MFDKDLGLFKFSHRDRILYFRLVLEHMIPNWVNFEVLQRLGFDFSVITQYFKSETLYKSLHKKNFFLVFMKLLEKFYFYVRACNLWISVSN